MWVQSGDWIEGAIGLWKADRRWRTRLHGGTTHVPTTRSILVATTVSLYEWGWHASKQQNRSEGLLEVLVHTALKTRELSAQAAFYRV